MQSGYRLGKQCQKLAMKAVSDFCCYVLEMPWIFYLLGCLNHIPEDLIQICGFFTNDEIVKERLSDFGCCGLLLDFKHALHAF